MYSTMQSCILIPSFIIIMSSGFELRIISLIPVFRLLYPGGTKVTGRSGYQAVNEDREANTKKIGDYKNAWTTKYQRDYYNAFGKTKLNSVGAICERQICADGWWSYGGMCWMFFPYKNTWEGAKEVCQSHGGQLGEYGHPHTGTDPNRVPSHAPDRHRVFLYTRLRESLQALPDWQHSSSGKAPWIEIWFKAPTWSELRPTTANGWHTKYVEGPSVLKFSKWADKVNIFPWTKQKAGENFPDWWEHKTYDDTYFPLQTRGRIAKLPFICMRKPIEFSATGYDNVSAQSERDKRITQAKQIEVYKSCDRSVRPSGKAYGGVSSQSGLNPMGTDTSQSAGQLVQSTLKFNCAPGRPGFYCGGCTIQTTLTPGGFEDSPNTALCDETTATFTGSSGTNYRGCQNRAKITEGGVDYFLPCQKWDTVPRAEFPSSSGDGAKESGNLHLASHNYCRNYATSGQAAPWCFVRKSGYQLLKATCAEFPADVKGNSIYNGCKIYYKCPGTNAKSLQDSLREAYPIKFSSFWIAQRRSSSSNKVFCTMITPGARVGTEVY
jgi:hypothetical protein